LDKHVEETTVIHVGKKRIKKRKYRKPIVERKYRNQKKEEPFGVVSITKPATQKKQK